jgi:xanthine dehydrogenase YagT iron-sulfur-binding subunit
MSKKPKKMSRRKFIKNLSTGVVGTTVAIEGLKALPQGKNEEEVAPHRYRIPLNITVNGKKHISLVDSHTTLADFLRQQLHLTGTKIVCNHGECGACTVLLNGKAVYSCHLLALDAEGQEVTTIEGLMEGENLHPLQKAFLEHDGYQCGFCTPGQIMAAQAILLNHPEPSRKDILIGMSGNICRCGAYPHILKAAMIAAKVK